MEWLNTILDYYDQNTMVFVFAALIILVLLIFRFKSFFFRLFLIALVLFATYIFIAHFAGVASRHKESMIEKHFPKERLK
ncbi:MAG: hypothetical protein JSW70_08310 [Syntrophobacterales bacterium]|nr:MAG: hypothetical protein JSW70_08310 [Syntrophobacterales bacterium]